MKITLAALLIAALRGNLPAKSTYSRVPKGN